MKSIALVASVLGPRRDSGGMYFSSEGRLWDISRNEIEGEIRNI